MTRNFAYTAAAVFAGLMAAAVSIWLVFGDRFAQPSFTVLTASELEIYNDASTQVQASPSRAIKMTATNGPQIKVAAPSGFSLTSPVDFDIVVQPRDGRPVDMSSLKIEYRLGPAWVNLTGRIMKRARVDGQRLFAQGADLPSGKHTLRVSIKDSEAQATQALISFSVK